MTEGKSLSIVKAIHEWNFWEVCHYSIAISKDFIMALKKIMLWDKGPIFEHCPDFDMAFRLFLGYNGVIPLSKGLLHKKLLLSTSCHFNANETEDIVGSIDVPMRVVLPTIKDNTGRDLGPAKRMAQLVGKNSYFAQRGRGNSLSTFKFRE
ncbi:hypothetical protein Tco_0033378 [Tanacetum coccineum]